MLFALFFVLGETVTGDTSPVKLTTVGCDKHFGSSPTTPLHNTRYHHRNGRRYTWCFTPHQVSRSMNLWGLLQCTTKHDLLIRTALLAKIENEAEPEL